MKTNFLNKYKSFLLILLCITLFLSGTPIVPITDVYATTTTKISTSSASVVCGSTAKIKNKTGKKYKYHSSNTKVATIDAKGKIKTLRLGVTKITVKKGKKKYSYKITVVPKNYSDLYLNREAVLPNQEFQLKLISKKYDTSQIKATYTSGYQTIKKDGSCSGLTNSGWGSITFAYGKYKAQAKLWVLAPAQLYDSIVKDVKAGETKKIQYQTTDGKIFTPSSLLKSGIKIQINDMQIPNSVIFYPGNHSLSIIANNINFTNNFSVSYNVKNALKKRNAIGFADEDKQIFDQVFKILDEIIDEDMTDKQKVKAIHDYLTLHADYYNHNNVSKKPGWAYAAKGVLLKQEGVCNSYTLAFCMMATAVGLKCDYVRGTAKNRNGYTENHAWNRVKLNDTWYYLDVTWDDPIGGGKENYDYYLTKTLWKDHIIEEEYDPVDKDIYYWHTYYLTGTGWDK